MKTLLNINLLLLSMLLFSCSSGNDNDKIVIENSEFKLTISDKGYAESLIHKPTKQQCLYRKIKTPLFAVKLHDRLPNQEMLLYPFNSKILPAEKIVRKGDQLIVSFKIIPHEVCINLNIDDNYIAFSLADVEAEAKNLSEREIAPLEELVFLQLPIKKRKHFGEWLNVTYDEKVAINILATDHYSNIVSEEREGHYLMQAVAVDEIKSLGVGAALIVTKTDSLLSKIERLETNFKLPPGAANRQRDENRYSYYWAYDITPDNVDKHIRYAKAGGFKFMLISCNTFALPASFSWFPAYSNGIEDLRGVVEKVNKAGIIAGLHTYSTKSDKNDIYVTGEPDHRLAIRKYFTLSESIDENSKTITVEENPATCTMSQGRRLLKIGDELVQYNGYSTEPPYQFLECERAVHRTTASAYQKGFKFGLLDVDTWTRWICFDQQTSIQQEVAEKIGEIYSQAGFQFIYLDGAEDVNPPYWHNIALSQQRVISKLNPYPVFIEGAARAHYSWHILDRSNAFDLQEYPPSQIKDMIRNYPMREAEMLERDFSKGNFGWIANQPSGFWKGEDMGVQPDMIEFSTSRAAGWDTGTSLWTTVAWSEANQRNDDILEIFNLWERAREENFLTEKDRMALRDPHVEHTLLVNEMGNLELLPYFKLKNINIKEIRAFYFRRKGEFWVVFWHTTGEGRFILPIDKNNIEIFSSLDSEPIELDIQQGKTLIEVSNRNYMRLKNISLSQIESAFSSIESFE